MRDCSKNTFLIESTNKKLYDIILNIFMMYEFFTNQQTDLKISNFVISLMSKRTVILLDRYLEALVAYRRLPTFSLLTLLSNKHNRN